MSGWMSVEARTHARTHARYPFLPLGERYHLAVMALVPLSAPLWVKPSTFVCFERVFASVQYHLFICFFYGSFVGWGNFFVLFVQAWPTWVLLRRERGCFGRLFWQFSWVNKYLMSYSFSSLASFPSWRFLLTVITLEHRLCCYRRWQPPPVNCQGLRGLIPRCSRTTCPLAVIPVNQLTLPTFPSPQASYQGTL